jgi:SulP family sulfate permease
VITGLVMLALGLLRMGRLVRFIPNAVLTGFINAVAVNIVLGQLANLTGYESDAGNRVTRSIDTLVQVSSFDWPTLAIGLVTIGLILLLERTRVGALALVAAVVVTSTVVAVLGLTSVKTLSDIATIPSTLPHPTVPDLALLPALLVPALSLALVGLVQGAAISSSMPNPDGRYPDASGDFRGQGIANVAAGVFQGMPVAGSMSATSLVTVSGARSRMANLSAGLTMAVLILTVGGLIGGIAMPALAGLLILVGMRTFKPDNVAMVWRTGRTQATVMVTTFVLTLLIPLQYAVLVGVGLSVILYVASQSNRVTITRWVFDEPDGLATEAPVPAELPAGETVVLQPYGSLFFAAAPVFEEQLPRVTPASTGSVVIIRLRGKQELGSTFITVLARYRDQLDDVGSTLMLAGLSDRVYRQLATTGVLTTIGSDSVFTATPRVTESLRQALTAAQAWRATRPGDARHPG